MATKTEKNVQLKINKMTKNIFDQLSVQGLISEDELYLLPEDEMVVPSQTNPGYAKDADHALQASASEWSTNAGYAENAGYARGADLANTAENAATASRASTADTALTANIALTADTANTANTALSTTYAPDYTPLSTFNQTLGNLSSIIHEI